MVLSKSKPKGFTLIDVLVGTALMLIVFLGVFAVYQLSLRVIAMSGAMVTATALANQKIEEIRNLTYREVRYVPEGKILKTEASPDNKYTITTTIIPISDCFDGPRDPDIPECVDVPLADSCVNDYKRVKVEVSWSARVGGKMSLVTDVVPETLTQECEESKGILSVSVIDANYEQVVSPTIQIFYSETGAFVDEQSPLDGEYDFSLYPEHYKVKVTAFTYSQQTYGQGDEYCFDGQEITIAEPEKEHPLVKVDDVVDVGFQMDKLSSIKVQTMGTEVEGYPAIGGIPFTIWQSKSIGNDSDGDPIYKYLYQGTTDGETGEKLIPDLLEFDSYYFYYFSESCADYDLVETQPFQPVDLLPDESIIVKLILEPENSFLVTVLDISTHDPIFGASVHLSNLDYDQRRPTDGSGQAFFIPLAPATYNLEIRATGFLTHQEQILISEEEDKVIQVELTHVE